ncbi:MAG: hypothetical protein RL518_2387 [Pseudomonadota bacterium]
MAVRLVLPSRYRLCWSLVIMSMWTCTLGTFMSPVLAQEGTLQSSLFEDCDKATESFSKLSPEAKAGLVDYLTRVVALNTQAPAAPEAFAVLPNGKGMEPNPAALWQTTDAKRELRGKRCALELLTLAGPLAFHAVPPLATLYSEQALSDEIAVGIEETTASIAEEAHKNGQVPTDEVMERMILSLTSERPLVTQNFLQEYLSLTLPRILTHLSTLSPSDADKVVTFLRDVDPDGSRSMRTFVELVQKLTSENANRLASYLPFPSKDASAPLLNDFARLAADPTHGPHVASLLGKSCVLLGGILIDPSSSAMLGRNPSLIRGSQLSETEQRCLVSSIPSLASSLLPLLTSSQEIEQRRALTLLPSALPILDGERKNALFLKIKEIASQPASPVRSEALLSLSLFTDRRPDVHTVLLGVLKTSLAQKSTPNLDATIDATCQSAATLNTPKDSARYSPFVMEALKRGISLPGVMALAAQISAIESQVVSLISPTTVEASNRILTGLKGKENLSKNSLVTIAEALRHPTLSIAAESLLIKQGDSIVPLLRKTLLKSSTTQRLGILALLEVFGAASKSERTELLNTLVSSDSCDALHARPRTVQSLLQSGDSDKALYDQFVTKVVSCLCTFDHAAGSSLTRASATTLFVQPQAVQNILTNQTQCGHLQPDLVAITQMTSVPESVRAHLLNKLLELGERKTIQEALSSLSRNHPLAEQALPGVRALAASLRNDPQLAYLAVLALARLGDTQFEWHRFVGDAIDMSESNPNFQTALEIIKTLSPDIVLAEVSPALDSDKPDRVAGACRIGATLGPLAIPIVSKVWNLREKKSPRIKYSAILALLEINPLTPDLNQGLRAILVNRYYASAASRPIQWRQSVAVVDLDKSTFGTLRTVHLERLLLK